MLEMDLQAQGGAIWETQQEKDPLLEHNRKMMKKMKEENIPWAESYPGELYPTEQDRELNTSHKNNEDVAILISKYKGQKVNNEQVAEIVSATCFVSAIGKLF